MSCQGTGHCGVCNFPGKINPLHNGKSLSHNPSPALQKDTPALHNGKPSQQKHKPALHNDKPDMKLHKIKEPPIIGNLSLGLTTTYI